MRISLITVLASFMMPGSVWSANITQSDPSSHLTEKFRSAKEVDWADTFVPIKVIHVEGEIVPGDARKLQATLDDILANDTRVTPDIMQRHILITLDSVGGSFREGVDMARILDQAQIPTMIEAGSECLSACAVIFMAGTEQFPEGRETHTRIVEMPAKLGFHRPFIEDFTTEIPADLVEELGAEELQKIFSEDYLAAFDLANQLIQEMLSVDPNAWQNDLLVKMLTATNSSVGGPFVYLTTVSDAIDWNIEILNLREDHGTSRVERYERAFWLCYNVAKRVEFSDKGFWPDGETAHEVLDFNIGPLREGVQAPSWIGPRTEPDGRTFNITMEQLGGSGCQVSFGDREQSALIDFTTVGGPSETLYFSNAADRIAQFPENAPLADLMQGSDKPIPYLGGNPKPMGRCLVYSGQQKSDDEPCSVITSVDPEIGQISTYVWPSGGKTVIVRNDDLLEINGRVARDVDLPEADAYSCFLNTGSGNTFCFAPL